MRGKGGLEGVNGRVYVILSTIYIFIIALSLQINIVSLLYPSFVSVIEVLRRNDKSS